MSLLLALLLSFSAPYLELKMWLQDEIAMYFWVSTGVVDRNACLEVVTSSDKGYVAFKTGEVKKGTSLILRWSRQGLPSGTYSSYAMLYDSCGPDQEPISSSVYTNQVVVP